MARPKKAAPAEVEATPEAPVDTPGVNPAIDPNSTAEQRLQALADQHAEMQAQAGEGDYPVK
jgi:hypothetical protein